MRVTGHSPWVVLPTLLAALLVGLAATRPVVAQQTNTVQCSSASTIVSGSSNARVEIPDMGVASASVQVPAFTGVYVQAIVLTLSLSHPNFGDLAIVLGTPNGNTPIIKPPNATGADSGTTVRVSQVNGAIQFYNDDCSEYATLPPATDGGSGPFPWTSDMSIWGIPGNTNIVNGVYSIQVADSKPGGNGFITGFEVKIVGQRGELQGSPVQMTLLSAFTRYQSHHSCQSPGSSQQCCIRIHNFSMCASAPVPTALPFCSRVNVRLPTHPA
jgi:subtilisin-like proprotein convertase family protein